MSGHGERRAGDDAELDRRKAQLGLEVAGKLEVTGVGGVDAVGEERGGKQ
jgi:hypothetical protein